MVAARVADRLLAGRLAQARPGATVSQSLVVADADGKSERVVVAELGSRVSRCGGAGFDWSADGTKIVLSGPSPAGMYVMDADGSNHVRVMRDARLTGVVAWRPLP